MKTNGNFHRNVYDDLAKIHKECAGQPNLVRLEYLYYCQNDLKGEELVEDLEKLNYEGEVDATGRKCDCARVYGKTDWITNDEETIKKWYREMKDVGWYFECDFSCYSVTEDRLVSMENILDNTQVVNETKFEIGKEVQACATPMVMEILRRFGEEQGAELVLEFFFYTNERSKAESLEVELKKFGYNVFVLEDKKTERELKFSITGQTIPLPNEDDVIEKWAVKMNELGFIHDCEFDGWGTPMTNGGWFSDDTPDEIIRKRLGLPPRENEE